jgi:protein subunit release factor B
MSNLWHIFLIGPSRCRDTDGSVLSSQCSAPYRRAVDVCERMRKLEISEADLDESFARSSGPGGQNVNKVSTAVTLRHLPSGISVTVQDSRSQAVNRKLARERLLDAIESIQKARRAAEIAEHEKARRRKSPRPPALKRKILESKRKRGELKKQRAKIQL